ncbi:MAG: Na+:solute symporter [Nitrospiraceae bacterium]|nr:Na+:solute symporter [Nitrospiraceae bacterium]
MQSADWLIVLLFLAASLVVGLYFTRRASSGLGEFFLSGRNLPWWLAGTSMAATSFSADTPLYVTGLVREHGIYENWQWWCFILSGMLSVYFFARLWRRLGIVTDVELINLRYSGKEASVLRGFKALYFSFAIHTIIKAQVILAMAKIMGIALGWGKWESIGISSSITIAYTMLSGYWGVVTTDFFQFIIAMTGAIVLAFAASSKAGGIAHIKAVLPAHVLSFFPSPGSAAFMAFLGYISLSWWSKYSSDGGGVLVQRMASSKDERQSFFATLYFNVATFALRTWPWVVAALASLVLYPHFADNEAVYPKMMVDLLPVGLRGLMLASFFAAFMSCLSTYLNLSSAYFVNDFYKPFIRPGKDDRHYIKVARIMVLVLSVATAIITYNVSSIIGVFKFLIAFGSGTGLVYIMRWFWWRINAWSEISALVASSLFTAIVYTSRVFVHMPYYGRLSLIIGFSTAVWVAVTFLTKPVEPEKLRDFYRRTTPGGPGWGPVKAGLPADQRTAAGTLTGAFTQWVLGCVFLVGLTLGIGEAVLGFYLPAFLWLSASALTGFKLYRPGSFS